MTGHNEIIVNKDTLFSRSHYNVIFMSSLRYSRSQSPLMEGFTNAEIQNAGQIQSRGSKYIFKVTAEEDLNRRIIKSDSCVISFPELEFEIPAERGTLTTIEGLLTTALDELTMLQPQRLAADPGTYEKIDTFIKRGREFSEGKVLPFTVILDDSAGNSWIDRNPDDSADKWKQIEYLRTPEQNAALGLSNPDAQQQEEEVIGADDVHTFMGPCPSCTRPCATHMMPVDIPHFKQVIIMSTVCEFCGYKSNEVKTGGEVPEKGRKITLKVEDADDLSRDILKVCLSLQSVISE
jgi:zinc finger protein